MERPWDKYMHPITHTMYEKKCCAGTWDVLCKEIMIKTTDTSSSEDGLRREKCSVYGHNGKDDDVANAVRDVVGIAVAATVNASGPIGVESNAM